VRRRTADAAHGKWRDILIRLGLDGKFLRDQHGPCPLCGGKDRFRWDNKDGNGTYICNQCGAGNGFNLVMNFNGWDFARAAREIDAIVDNVEAEAPTKAEISDERRNALLNDLWSRSRPLSAGDLAHGYLSRRVKLPASAPACLRFVESCRAPDKSTHPALLAQVANHPGRPINIHRTFLGPNGKADMPDPRAMMPGKLPDGSAVRLFPVHGERLGIAEGIETAFAASARFGLPVWSAINATMLQKWEPPVGVTEVWVFGDCDVKFGGQAAAYALAHRLTVRLKLNVQVHIPRVPGCDWADRDAC
jgi:putative DNA primase/helicase